MKFYKKAVGLFYAKETNLLTDTQAEISCVGDKKKNKKKQDVWFRGRKRSRS